MASIKPFTSFMFPAGLPTLTMEVGQHELVVSASTILKCPADSCIVDLAKSHKPLSELLYGHSEDAYVALESETRTANVMCYVLHYIDTGHLVYPRDIGTATDLYVAMRDLGLLSFVGERFAKDSRTLTTYEVFVLLTKGRVELPEDIKSFQTVDGVNTIDSGLYRETIIILAEVATEGRFTLQIWGSESNLQKIFPKEKWTRDKTFWQLDAAVVFRTCDQKDFLNLISSTMTSKIVGQLGFRLTTYSSWRLAAKCAFYTKWIFYRETQNEATLQR